MNKLDYDDLATDYARHRRTYPGLIEHVVSRAGITNESAVLEVGCGTANHLTAIHQVTGARCVGVDPSKEMLLVAADQPAELELHSGRAEELDFPAHTFDLILSVDMIHYVREPQRYFDSAFAALKPGGHLLTVTDSEWLIRNRMPMAHYFPSTIEAEESRFHPIPALAGHLALAGFGDLYERVIESTYLLDRADKFEDRSFSALHLIPVAEFEAGLAALKADLANGPLPANLRSCALWGRRPA